jgi:putative transcriptional regulator
LLNGIDAMNHIASDEYLLDHAAGADTARVSLLLDTHLALNPEARRRYRGFEAVGGALLSSIEPVDTAPGAFERLMARIDSGEGSGAPAVAAAAARDDSLLPAPLRARVGADIAALDWRQVTRGVHEATLDVVGPDGERAALLRIAAGRAVPRHTHRGAEMTLVLDGAYDDAAGHYARGDLSIADPSIDHRPVACDGRDCLCLVVTTAPIRLTGPLLRLLNPFLSR